FARACNIFKNSAFLNLCCIQYFNKLLIMMYVACDIHQKSLLDTYYVKHLQKKLILKYKRHVIFQFFVFVLTCTGEIRCLVTLDPLQMTNVRKRFPQIPKTIVRFI